jgi:hypothetical protein
MIPPAPSYLVCYSLFPFGFVQQSQNQILLPSFLCARVLTTSFETLSFLRVIVPSGCDSAFFFLRSFVMTTLIQVEVTYTTCGSYCAELPKGKTWDDVQTHWVKWDVLHLLFKGETEPITFELGTGCNSDSTDFKRPNTVNIFETDEDGTVNFDKELACEELV